MAEDDWNDWKKRRLLLFQVQQPLLGVDIHTEVAQKVESQKSGYFAIRDYVVNGGWATFGQERPFELADACAEALNKL